LIDVDIIPVTSSEYLFTTTPLSQAKMLSCDHPFLRKTNDLNIFGHFSIAVDVLHKSLAKQQNH
jgi:hypothetical protein